jgi:hypothetical protein
MPTNNPENPLIERLSYWENELELEPSASPDPVVRLDHMIEAFITEETRYMEKQSALTRENKRLRYRWTSLRKLLGIEQKQEERYP